MQNLDNIFASKTQKKINRGLLLYLHRGVRDVRLKEKLQQDKLQAKLLQ